MYNGTNKQTNKQTHTHTHTNTHTHNPKDESSMANGPCVMNINNSLTRKETDNRVAREKFERTEFGTVPRREL